MNSMFYNYMYFYFDVYIYVCDFTKAYLVEEFGNN